MSDAIQLRVCSGCGTLQAYARPVCHACRGRDFAAAMLPLPGTIYSLTTVHRAPAPQFADDVPYTLALVRGERGGLVLMRLQQAAASSAIGDVVRIEADAAGGVVAVPASPVQLR